MYHITKKGEVDECTAQIKCRIGGDHYESKEAAEKAIHQPQKTLSKKTSEKSLLSEMKDSLESKDYEFIDSKNKWRKSEKETLGLLSKASDEIREFGEISPDTRSKVSGLHFAKEALSDSERVMLKNLENLGKRKFVDVENVDFSKGLRYRKSSKVRVRSAKKGEKITKTLKDGTVETSRVLEGNERIITNPSGEEYVVSDETLNSKYTPEGGGVYRAKGEVTAVRNPFDGPITIDAPWGEKQYGDRNCLIARNDEGERYIIGNREFSDTYSQKEKEKEPHFVKIARDEVARKQKVNSTRIKIDQRNLAIKAKKMSKEEINEKLFKTKVNDREDLTAVLEWEIQQRKS